MLTKQQQQSLCHQQLKRLSKLRQSCLQSSTLY